MKNFLERVCDTIFDPLNLAENIGNKLIERNTLWARILYALGGTTLGLYVVCVGILFALFALVYITGLWIGQITIAPLYWVLTGKKIEFFNKELESIF